MNHYFKIVFGLLIIPALLALWGWLEYNDFFWTDYRALTAREQKTFEWNSETGEVGLIHVFSSHFRDEHYAFPRQKVSSVKLFRNYLIGSTLAGRTLKTNKIDSLIRFCNNPGNFNLGETTWGVNESEYLLRFYNSSGKVIGKLYLCLDQCGMTASNPFCPAMKFGGLSPMGLKKIKSFIADNGNWNAISL